MNVFISKTRDNSKTFARNDRREKKMAACDRSGRSRFRIDTCKFVRVCVEKADRYHAVARCNDIMTETGWTELMESVVGVLGTGNPT